MVQGIWGKKVGMTQFFSDAHKVVPVTVIDVSQWYIVHIKTKALDGYSAVQLGRVRDEFAQTTFSSDWVKGSSKYFSALREVAVANDEHALIVGQQADVGSIIGQGEIVDIMGTTIGRGFQGVMKRYGFSGGRASHGDKLGRGPGSLSFMRRQGRVVKGKRMPGHMGVERRTMKNIQVVKVEPASHMIFVKGSVPGKAGALVFVRKRG